MTKNSTGNRGPQRGTTLHGLCYKTRAQHDIVGDEMEESWIRSRTNKITDDYNSNGFESDANNFRLLNANESFPESR